MHIPQGAILITGCSSGIGLYCAQALKKSGFQVLASARKETDVELLKEQGLNACVLDVDDPQSIESGLQWAIEQSDGNLYALFNNAGFGIVSAVEDLSHDAMLAQFSTNVIGTQTLTNQFINHLRRNGSPPARIIYNSSVLGYVSIPFRGAYNASKYALEGFADSLRLELARDPIEIVLIEPGPITSKFRLNAIASFNRWIDPDKSHFKGYYAKQAAIYSDVNNLPKIPFTLEPDAVYRALLHALTNRHPKARYRITFPSKLFYLCKRLLPTRWLDAVLLKI